MIHYTLGSSKCSTVLINVRIDSLHAWASEFENSSVRRGCGM